MESDDENNILSSENKHVKNEIYSFNPILRSHVADLVLCTRSDKENRIVPLSSRACVKTTSFMISSMNDGRRAIPRDERILII
jgi:hypothetical protein